MPGGTNSVLIYSCATPINARKFRAKFSVFFFQEGSCCYIYQVTHEFFSTIKPMMCSHTHLGHSFSYSLTKRLNSLTHFLWYIVFFRARMRQRETWGKFLEPLEAHIQKLWDENLNFKILRGRNIYHTQFYVKHMKMIDVFKMIFFMCCPLDCWNKHYLLALYLEEVERKPAQCASWGTKKSLREEKEHT